MFKNKDPFDQAVLGTITVFGGALVILAAWNAVSAPDPQAADQTESAMVEPADEEDTAEAAEEEASEEDTAEAVEEEASGEDTAEAAEEPIEPEATGDETEEVASDSETADAPEEEATEEDTAEAASDDGWSSEQMAYLDGDAEAGARVWNQCRACHVADQEQNRVGPHLVGVIGRDVASIDGFRYSSALQDLQGQQWTPEQLDAWLENPRDYAPGTSMSYPGLRNEGDRRDLLAYLYDMHN